MNHARRQWLKGAGAVALGALPASAAAAGEGSSPAHSVDGARLGGGKNHWQSALVLDRGRKPVGGSTRKLADAIRRGADLRIYTEFRHNEHIDTNSTNPELIQEVADFRVTYLLEERWVAGIINLRQPIELPDGFGPRPSMSFFLYN